MRRQIRGLIRRLADPRLQAQHDRCHAATQREERKSPARFTVINWLLTKTRERRYLEIGVRNPEDCFLKIQADYRLSVDPGLEASVNRADIKLTSDEFFAQLHSGALALPTRQFDVIFIDGLHLAEQAYRDLCHAMAILAKPGYLVVHDCNPPTRHHAREEFREEGPAEIYWNGTTWKAFQRFRTEHSHKAYVIDGDWGVGVIEAHTQADTFRLDPNINPFYEYAVFEANRQQILNLIDFRSLTGGGAV
jgi:methyltransferase family protein